MTSALHEVANLVRLECGIELGPPQFASLEAAVARVEPGMTPERLLEMDGSEAPLQRLINEVTVHETFFLRHPGELEAIDWHRSLDAANDRGSDAVRVWVAGCASGEEAYTVAIVACEAFGSATPPVHVLATDIATAGLEQAQRGRYDARAVAGITGQSTSPLLHRAGRTSVRRRAAAAAGRVSPPEPGSRPGSGRRRGRLRRDLVP